MPRCGTARVRLRRCSSCHGRLGGRLARRRCRRSTTPSPPERAAAGCSLALAVVGFSPSSAAGATPAVRASGRRPLPLAVATASSSSPRRCSRSPSPGTGSHAGGSGTCSCSSRSARRPRRAPRMAARRLLAESFSDIYLEQTRGRPAGGERPLRRPGGLHRVFGADDPEPRSRRCWTRTSRPQPQSSRQHGGEVGKLSATRSWSSSAGADHRARGTHGPRLPAEMTADRATRTRVGRASGPA